MTPNTTTIEAMEAARRGDVVTLGSPEDALAELNREEAGNRVVILGHPLPEGHCIIAGQEYRWTYDLRELSGIVYPDGSRPTACALVPVRGEAR